MMAGAAYSKEDQEKELDFCLSKTIDSYREIQLRCGKRISKAILLFAGAALLAYCEPVTPNGTDQTTIAVPFVGVKVNAPHAVAVVTLIASLCLAIALLDKSAQRIYRNEISRLYRLRYGESSSTPLWTIRPLNASELCVALTQFGYLGRLVETVFTLIWTAPAFGIIIYANRHWGDASIVEKIMFSAALAVPYLAGIGGWIVLFNLRELREVLSGRVKRAPYGPLSLFFGPAVMSVFEALAKLLPASLRRRLKDLARRVFDN